MCSHAINNAICQRNHESCNEIIIYLVQRFIKIDRGIICLWSLLKWTLNTFERLLEVLSSDKWVGELVCVFWGVEGTGVYGVKIPTCISFPTFFAILAPGAQAPMKEWLNEATVNHLINIHVSWIQHQFKEITMTCKQMTKMKGGLRSQNSISSYSL